MLQVIISVLVAVVCVISIVIAADNMLSVIIACILGSICSVANIIIAHHVRKKKKSKNPCKNCRIRKRVCIGCPVALRKEYYHGRNRDHEQGKKGN